MLQHTAQKVLFTVKYIVLAAYNITEGLDNCVTSEKECFGIFRADNPAK